MEASSDHESFKNLKVKNDDADDKLIPAKGHPIPSFI